MTTTVQRQPVALGILLKEWRKVRNVSQFSLAMSAGVSPRYLSFVETGRSKPTAAFLLKLAEALRMPLEERNVLLGAAGLPDAYESSPLTSATQVPFRQALTRLLSQQEPYPAVLLDRSWNVVQTNNAAPRLFSRFIDLARFPEPRNLLRTLLAPDGLHLSIENWAEVAGTLAQRVFREAPAGRPDDAVLQLLPELRAAAAGDGSASAAAQASLPFHPVVFRKEELRLAFFSMITTVGAPLTITAEHLRLESFFPADEATEVFARQHLA